MKNRSSEKKAIVFVGLTAIAIFLVAIALQVVAIVFAIINGLALFGPNGDITSVWHWVWFVLCSLWVISGVTNTARSVSK